MTGKSKLSPERWQPPLPARLQPDEAVGGFFIRYCQTNGWVSLPQFCTAIGVTMAPCQTQLGDLHQLDTCLDPVPGTFPSKQARLGKRAVSLLNGHTLPERLFRTSQRAVCKSCLNETGYMRSWWDIRFLKACPIHNEVLDQILRMRAPIDLERQPTGALRTLC